MGNIPEEVLLALAAKNSGGGSGGTSNYEDLENKPKINGETLSGNKSASDLGLASTADLAGKVDKVEGKVLSTNDYTDADKAIVAGVTTALAGKQDVFTSGDYLEMSNGVLNVTKNKGNDLYSYKFITTSTSDWPRVKIQRYINGVFQSEETYNNDDVRTNPVTLDGLFTFTYGVDGYRWQYTLLANSHQHNVGEVVKWMYNVSVDSTESFDVVPQDTSKNLVLQEDLDAALALKQDKTDNNLTTTNKTTTGAINELKSGLTNVQSDVKLNTQDLTTPSRSKNVINILDKASETINGVTAVCSGGVITLTGEISGDAEFYFSLGAPVVLDPALYKIAFNNTATNQYMSIRFRSGTTTLLNYAPNVANRIIENWSDSVTCNRLSIAIPNGYFTEMSISITVLDKTATDPTFAPYIPSVESRIEAVESVLTNQGGNITPATNVTNDTVDYSIIRKMGNVVTAFVSLVIDDTISAWTKVADLPIGFRPIHTTMTVGWMTTTSEPCLVRIGDDGSIMLSKAVSTGKVQFSVSYIVN